MRHKKKYRKLGLTTNQRKALLRGLALSLLEHGSIVTTKARAKELKSYVERIITKVKKQNETHARRLVFQKLQNKQVVKKLFDEYKSEFETRPGGYTRIHLLGPRPGDAAEMARISLILGGTEVEAEEAAPAEEPKPKKKAAKKAPKAEPAKEETDKPEKKKKTAAKKSAKKEAADEKEAKAAESEAATEEK